MTDRWRRAAPAGLVLVSVAVFLVFFVVEMGTRAVLLPSVEKRIGAQIRSPVVRAGGNAREVMAFEYVRPGACANAGIVSGYIVVSHRFIGALSRQLRGPAGKQVVVEVVAGGDGPPIEARPSRLVTITLP
jgi:hypothetical protein